MSIGASFAARRWRSRNSSISEERSDDRLSNGDLAGLQHLTSIGREMQHVSHSANRQTLV